MTGFPERRLIIDILPALKDGDSSVEGTMPRTENTECSLISPVQQATPVAQPTGDRSAKTNAFEHDSGFTSSSSEDNRIPLVAKERTTVGGVIAIADVASMVEKKANCVRRTIQQHSTEVSKISTRLFIEQPLQASEKEVLMLLRSILDWTIVLPGLALTASAIVQSLPTKSAHCPPSFDRGAPR